MTLSGKQKLNLAVTAGLMATLAFVANLSVRRVAVTAEDFAHQAETGAQSSLHSVEEIDAKLKVMADGDKILPGEIESYRVDKKFMHADGGSIWGDLSVSGIRGEDGQSRGHSEGCQAG